MKYQKYDIKADLWSVGTIAYEILTGTQPFRSKTHVELMQRIETQKVTWPKNVGVSQECLNFVNGLLQKDPRKRFSWELFFTNNWLELQNVIQNNTKNPKAFFLT